MVEPHTAHVSRRNFLRTAGAGVGALATPLASPWTGTSTTGAGLTVGVLLPRSTIYPALSENFVAGMRLALAHNHHIAGGRPITLVAQHVAPSASAAEREARALFERKHIHLLVSVLGTTVTAGLRKLVDAHHAILLAGDVGAHVVGPRDGSPNIFHSSLNFWQTNWAMGQWASQHLGKRALIATSLYDSGYDSAYAFRLGLESAGGTLLGTHVIDPRPGLRDPSPVLAEIERAQPDVVYGLMCGSKAESFAKAYAASPLAKSIPLAVSGFFGYGGSTAATALGAITCVPWADNLATGTNQTFSRTYRQQTGRAPDAFAVLGYDTARLIVESVDALNGRVERHEQFREALTATSLSSPRGRVTMSRQTQSTTGAVYIQRLQNTTHESTSTIATLDAPSDLDERLAPLRSEMRTGWLNGYLAI